MLTKGAHHVSLNVSDLERAREFYGELLGLPEIERPDFGLAGAWFQAGAVQLHLIVPPQGVDVGSTAPGLSPIANHLAFEVEDSEAVTARLEKAGYEVMSLGPEVGQQFTRDPHGNVIEFIRPGGQLGRPPG